MAVTHPDTIRNKFANQVTTDVDAGAGNGQMILRATAAEVATIPFNKPSFGAAASGVITLDVAPTPEDSNATGSGSSVDGFEVTDSDSNIIFQGAVPADLTLSKNPIDAGDVVQITSFTYTACP